MVQRIEFLIVLANRPHKKKKILEPESSFVEQLLEELEQIDRPSASDGEHRPSVWLVKPFAELGAPHADRGRARARRFLVAKLGIGAALGALGDAFGAPPSTAAGGRCLAPSARRGSPTTSRPDSGACAPILPRAHHLQHPAASSATAAAERTVVVIAHHDAANSGPHLPPAKSR